MTQTITCTCGTCKANGVAGKAVLIPTALSAVASTKQGRHGLVHMAFDTNAVTGAAARARTGVRPA